MFDLETSLGYLLNRAALLLRQELMSRLAAAGIDATGEEWAILAMLEAHGTMPVNALAERTLKDRTTVTRLLDRSEARGLLVRTRSDADARIVNVALTKVGRATVARMAVLAEGLLFEVTKGMTKKDLAATSETLRKLVERLASTTPSRERTTP